MQYQEVLNQIQKEIQPLLGQGKVADYIPALAGVSPKKFGMSVHTIGGEHFPVGDANELFSILIIFSFECSRLCGSCNAIESLSCCD